MSTKIFNGTLIKGDLKYAYEVGSDFRTIVQRMAQESIDRIAVNHAVYLIDSAVIKNESIDCLPIIRAFDLVSDEQDRVITNRERNPGFDFSCELTMFPDGDETLAIVVTEQQEFLDTWLSMPGVEAYPYYNNTDRPDYLTQEQWDARGDRWMRFFDGGAFFPANAMTVKCVDERLPPSMDKEVLAELMPSFEERLERVAKDYAGSRVIAMIEEENLERKISTFMKLHREHGSEFTKEGMDLYRDLISKDIPIEHLFENQSESKPLVMDTGV